MAQVALGVVGGVVGFMLGGPAGAAIGFGIGMAVTPEIPGPVIGEIARQTAKEGDPRLIVWGIVRPVGPNLIAVQDPPAVYKVTQGGKGGGGPRAEVPFRTYALGVCEGPITGYRRIWRNNKLVYDGRNGSVWGARNNPVFMQNATFYYGDYEQLPDPDLEAVFGVGEVPAHRGTAYIVIKNEDLQDTGGAVPQWLFEVVRAQYEYEPESTELVIAHEFNPNMTRVSVDDWEEIDSLGGNGSSYSSKYTMDMDLIIGSLGNNAKVYGRESGIEVFSGAMGSPPFGGSSSNESRTSFAYAQPTAPFVTILNIAYIDGSRYFSLDNPSYVPGAACHESAYSPDGSTLAVAHTQSFHVDELYVVTVYDVSTGYTRQSGLHAPDGVSETTIYSVAWHPTNDTLYAGGSSGFFYAINPANGNIEYMSDDYSASSQIRSISAHPAGLILAIGFNTGEVIVISSTTYELITTIPNSGFVVDCIKFSPGGKFMAYGINPLGGTGNSMAVIIDCENWTEVDNISDFGGSIRDIDWAPIQPVGL